MARGYKPPEGFLTLAQAQERLGVSRTKIWEMANDGTFEVFEDPRDRRYRLVRVEDVENLGRPRPRRPAEGT